MIPNDKITTFLDIENITFAITLKIVVWYFSFPMFVIRLSGFWGPF